ncbi:MAG TPA: ATP-binding protein [Chroococcales cyanobacterium]
MEAVVPRSHKRFRITDAAHIGDARRYARDLAIAAAMASETVGKIEIIVNEMATNLVKHTEQGGDLLVCRFDGEDAATIELLCIDRGRGIIDVEKSFTDGNSTAGTMGTGLGAIRRLSDCFDVWSEPGAGTLLKSRKGSAVSGKGVDIGVEGLSIALEGEELCGDGWAFARRSGHLWVCLVDGLGHGASAHLAAAAGLKAFAANFDASPIQVVKKADAAMRGTQGGAVYVGHVEREKGLLSYCSVGNITGRVFNVEGKSRGCVSMPGIVGYNMSSVKEFDQPQTAADSLVIATDGLKSSFNLTAKQLKSKLAPALLYRDFARGNDDVTAVVIHG